MKTLSRLLLAVALCSIARAQNINVQADATTGLLWRPSTLFSNTTNAAAIKSAAGIPSFSGNALKLLRLNAGETALEFVAAGAGTGTVTGFSVVTANGVSATVANPTTEPAATFTLGAITPSSVASTGAISGTTGTFSTLTSGRVPIVSTAGLLADDADLTFSGDTLTATKFAGALNGTVGATTPAAGAFTTGAFSGVVSATNATASTSKDTGAIIVTDGGIGVEGSVFAGTSINAGTASTDAGIMGIGAQTTSASMELGDQRSSDGNAFIDFHGDTTYTDFGLRVRRSGTADGVSHLLHRGTGNLEIITQEAGAIVLKTTNATALTIAASGAATFASTVSTTQLTSTIATGTAPLVVASTTKVDNLHVARATLADTVTTNANLTGDVTSVGNATTLAAGSASNLNSGTLPAARMPALTGDITTSSGAVATTLATVNSNVGTFGSATAAATVTVNAKGLVTAASNTTVTPAVGSITGLGTNVGTFLATPSSANLAAAITDEVGTGPAQFANIVFNAQTGTSYESVASDAGKWITMSNASANVLTIPDNATVAYASGVSIIVEMRGAGATSVSPKNANVTIQSRDSALKLYGQYSIGVLTLHTVSGDATTWNFSGDIKP